MSHEVIDVTAVDIQANRFETLSRLADDLAHEIKNPLNAVVINLELVRRRIRGGAGDQALQRLEVAEAETSRVHGLVDSLLQVLRPARDGGAAAEIGVALAELLPLLRLQAKLSGIEFGYEPPAGPLRVEMRRDSLKHAILNLVSNAVEAARPDGGRVVIDVQLDDGRARIRVRDTGAGVPPEVCERIGERGLTGRPGRTGLGLAVAAAIAREAEGRLLLEHAGGDGEDTTFVLELPLAGRA